MNFPNSSTLEQQQVEDENLTQCLPNGETETQTQQNT